MAFRAIKLKVRCVISVLWVVKLTASNLMFKLGTFL